MDAQKHAEDFYKKFGFKTVSSDFLDWSGAGETIRQIDIPDCYKENFEFVHHEEFTLKIPFTRESWNGRMKACRGIDASLTEKEISMWEQEHRTLLEHIAPDEFDILHYGAITELKKR